MNTINAKWLQPMPSWYHAWDFRDDPRLDTDCDLPSVNPKGDRECEFCGNVFEPTTPQGGHRKVCYSAECERDRKRRNSRLSARRVKARKRAQQA